MIRILNYNLFTIFKTNDSIDNKIFNKKIYVNQMFVSTYNFEFSCRVYCKFTIICNSYKVLKVVRWKIIDINDFETFQYYFESMNK